RPGGERVVLAVQTGITDGYTQNTDEIVDIGLPPLHNLTGHAVRLLSVQWVGQPASARIIRIYGSAYADLGHGFIGAEGNLPIACPGWYQPVPVPSVVTPPHRDSRWFVVISFTIAKPGFYHFNRVKIRYVTDGHRGWQYQNLYTSYKIVNPPLLGPVPIPRSGICG
ncbi:MAG TPA: hypothetical protein VF940_08300, partial [Streptosporangiaceae bacterium]